MILDEFSREFVRKFLEVFLGEHNKKYPKKSREEFLRQFLLDLLTKLRDKFQKNCLENYMNTWFYSNVHREVPEYISGDILNMFLNESFERFLKTLIVELPKKSMKYFWKQFFVELPRGQSEISDGFTGKNHYLKKVFEWILGRFDEKNT